jgi:hypothetical protein
LARLDSFLLHLHLEKERAVTATVGRCSYSLWGLQLPYLTT